MDLSGLSVEDLKALQAGKLDNVSVEGLNSIHQQMQQRQQATQQAQNPQAIGDAADKAAQNNNPNAKPTLNFATQYHPQDIGYTPGGTPASAALADPEGNERNAKIGVGLAVGGATAPLTAGMSGISGILGRAGVNAAGSSLQQYFGNLMDKQPATQNTGFAAGLGAAGSMAGDAIGGLAGLVKRPISTAMLAANPSKMSDMASGALNDGMDRLKSSESDNIAGMLQGKQVPVTTNQLTGIHPEIDSILSKYQGPYGDLPSEVSMDGQDANKVRSILDQEMSYKKLGPWAQSAETSARDSMIKPQADAIRGSVHDLDPELSDTIDKYSENLEMAKKLKSGAANSPTNTLTSGNTDQRGLFQDIDDRTGTNLQDLSSKLNDAKNLGNAIHGDKLGRAVEALGVSAVKGFGRGASDGNALSDPAVLQTLFGTASSRPKQQTQDQQ